MLVFIHRTSNEKKFRVLEGNFIRCYLAKKKKINKKKILPPHFVTEQISLKVTPCCGSHSLFQILVLACRSTFVSDGRVGDKDLGLCIHNDTIQPHSLFVDMKCSKCLGSCWNCQAKRDRQVLTCKRVKPEPLELWRSPSLFLSNNVVYFVYQSL